MRGEGYRKREDLEKPIELQLGGFGYFEKPRTIGVVGIHWPGGHRENPDGAAECYRNHPAPRVESI